MVQFVHSNSYYDDFLKAWKLSYHMIGQTPPSDDVIRLIFEMFKDYSPQMVLEAIRHHISTSEFVIKPANVFKYVNSKMGASPEELKKNAYIFFDKYLTNVSTADAVIEDFRMALAFKECFRSINDFLGRPNSEYSNSRDRELFANSVVNYQITFIEKETIQHVFKGKRNFRNTIQVSFMGDNYEICKELAQKHYALTGEDKQFKIEYPVDKTLQLTLKKEPPKEFTEQEKQESLNLMKELMDILKA